MCEARQPGEDPDAGEGGSRSLAASDGRVRSPDGVAESSVREFVHQVNQPLSAIANFARGTARRLRNGAIDAATLLPVIERIAAEAHRAADMVRRLREQIEAVPAHAAPVDLGRLARQVVRTLAAEAERAGVALLVDAMAPLPRVSCDPEAIAQVLAGVLRNRIAALATIRSTAPAIRLSVGPSADGIGVTVQDSAGIAPHDPSEPTAGDALRDTALAVEGLAAAGAIFRAHGGRFEARRDRRGALGLYFTLPLVAARDHARSTMAASVPARTSR
jgi:signal transduction histidine kinase